jgi:hypothetical protein
MLHVIYDSNLKSVKLSITPWKFVWWTEVKHRGFVTLWLAGNKWLVPLSGGCITGDWVQYTFNKGVDGIRARMDLGERRNHYPVMPEIEPLSYIPQPVNLLAELLRNLSTGCCSAFCLFRTDGFNSFHVYKSYPRNRPWRPTGLRDVKDPTLSRQSAHGWR